MTLRTEAEKERLYDLERSGAIYLKPAAICRACSAELAPRAAYCDRCGTPVTFAGAEQISPDEDRALDILLQRPAVLDLPTAKARALAEWEGTVKTRDDGTIQRWPMLEAVEIGRLADGTAVRGDFDNDDTPHVAWVEWSGFSICAGADGFDMGDQVNDKEYHHFTLAQWESLRALAASGVIDQAIAFARAWEAQQPDDIDSIIGILEAIDGGE
jgi:hypothetical protein